MEKKAGDKRAQKRKASKLKNDPSFLEGKKEGITIP
jgi:hypothetical protein